MVGDERWRSPLPSWLVYYGWQITTFCEVSDRHFGVFSGWLYSWPYKKKWWEVWLGICEVCFEEKRRNLNLINLFSLLFCFFCVFCLGFGKWFHVVVWWGFSSLPASKSPIECSDFEPAVTYMIYVSKWGARWTWWTPESSKSEAC